MSLKPIIWEIVISLKSIIYKVKLKLNADELHQNNLENYEVNRCVICC